MHEGLLAQADAVLARDGPAQLDHAPEDPVQYDLGPAHLRGVVGIDHQVGVDVAVAEMAEEDHAQVEFGGQAVDEGHHLRDAAARHDNVLIDLFRFQPGDGRRDAAPRLPEGLLLGGRFRPFPAQRLRPGHHIIEKRLALGHLGRAAVDLDQHRRLQPLVEGQPPVGMDGLQRAAVHELEHRRLDMGADDALHEAGAGRQRGEVDAEEQPSRRQGQQAQGGPGHHGQGAFRADQQRLQVVAGDVLDGLGAQAHLLAAHQEGLQPQDVVGGHAVLEAARAACVLGDVAADGRSLQAGRVGGVEKPRFFRRRLQVGGDHPRLDHGQGVLAVEAQDAVHAREDQHHAALDGQRPAAVADAGAARHQRHGVLTAEGDGGGDVLVALGADDGVGEVFHPGGVVGIAQQVLAVGEHLVPADSRDQLFYRFFLDHSDPCGDYRGSRPGRQIVACELQSHAVVARRRSPLQGRPTAVRSD